MKRRKKYCVSVQTDFRENDVQYVYADCAYHPIPEPKDFVDGIGLHYPEIPEKEVDPSCSSECDEHKEYFKKDALIYLKDPSYMQVVEPKFENRIGLIYPHRSRFPPFKQPRKSSLAEQYVILEPFHSLSYQGLKYLESCLSFESILDKLEMDGGAPFESRSRAFALRLLLRLPTQKCELEGPSTTSGRIENRVHLTTKGKHHRVLTPRCDTTIIQQLGRASAIIFLQKCLRGRANQISMETTRVRWEESYDELNGFNHSYQPKDMVSGIDLQTTIIETTIVKALVGQVIAEKLESLTVDPKPIIEANKKGLLL